MNNRSVLRYVASTESEAYNDLIDKIQTGARFGANKPRYEIVLSLLQKGPCTYEDVRHELEGVGVPRNLPEFISKLKRLLVGTGFSIVKGNGQTYTLEFKARSRVLVFFEAQATHSGQVLEVLKERNEDYIKEGKDIQIVEAGPLIGIYDLYAVFDTGHMEDIFNEVLVIQEKILKKDKVLVRTLRTVTYPIVNKGRWILEV